MKTTIDRAYLWVLQRDRASVVALELELEHDPGGAARDTELLAGVMARYAIRAEDVGSNFRLPSPERVRASVSVAVPNGGFPLTEPSVIPDSAFTEAASKTFPTLDEALRWAEGVRLALLDEGWCFVMEGL